MRSSASVPGDEAGAVAEAGAGRAWRAARRMLRHLLVHMRDRRFWVIQAMVIGATSAHYAIEMLGDTDPAGPLHAIALTALIVPLVYAALNFGSEGAVLTAIWSALLALPALWVWHEQHAHWVIEIAHLGIILPIGVVVAWRVDRETTQRRRAEQTSASLALLNDVAETLAEGLEIEAQIPAVLDRLVAGLDLRSLTLALAPGIAGGGQASFAAHPAATVAAEPPGETIAIVLAGKTGRLGTLTARTRGAAVGAEQQHVLSAAAHALQVSIENAVLRRQRQESLQLYARRVTEAHEDERKRLARELHDDTAQELVNLVRRLERLEEDSAPDVAAPLADAADLGRTILQGVRRYSHNLRPPVLDDLGVRAAIELVVDDAARQLAGGAELVVTGAPRRLSGPQELALFRIAQEALRNVEKHAGARSARVRLAFEPSRLTLSVSDDGVGFAVPEDVTSLAREGHFGLVGMQERAELIGGRFAVASGAGGTTITAQIADGELSREGAD